MRSNKWIKGAMILGLSFFISVLLVKPIGVSTQFSVLSGIIYNSVDKNLIAEDTSRESGYKSTNAYLDKNDGALAEEIINPINYGFVFVLAIPLGSYIAYKTSKKNEFNESEIHEDDLVQENCSLEDKGFLGKYFPFFLGGFLLLFGARFAGGCTSGHMMSGMMQSSVSGYVFAGVVFAVSIPTAIITKKSSRK